MKTAHYMNPLKASFPIPFESRDQDVSILLKVAKDKPNQDATCKLVNLLRRNGLYTIEDILNTSITGIKRHKHVGDKSISLLLMLLTDLTRRED